MLAVIIPTYNSQTSLAALLGQLSGKANLIVVSDGLSDDDGLKIAARSHAQIAIGTRSRGAQLNRGTRCADDADWFLFLHADSILPEDWYSDVQAHILGHGQSAGYFGLRFDSSKLSARFMEQGIKLRCFLSALPYGDQGLLISRALYEDIGGYPDWPLFEDVNLVERIGRSRLRRLPSVMTTDASKYETVGFFKRGWHNLNLLRRYKKGEPVKHLAKLYNNIDTIP